MKILLFKLYAIINKKNPSHERPGEIIVDTRIRFLNKWKNGRKLILLRKINTKKSFHGNRPFK